MATLQSSRVGGTEPLPKDVAFITKPLHNNAHLGDVLATGVSVIAVPDGGVVTLDPGATKLASTNTAIAVALRYITASASAYTIVEGDTADIKLTVVPEAACDITTVYATSDAAVATVSAGVITAVAPGTATIVVTTTDDNTGKSSIAELEITVTAA